MKQKFTFLAAAALLAGSVAYAQTNSFLGPDGYLHCGTDQAVAQILADHPEMKADFDARQQQAEEQDALDFRNGYHSAARGSSNPSVQSPPQYIIPIVFHIVHDYGSENISDAQVIDEVRILNNDYRKLNADTTNISTTFQGIASDASIEFRLANLDPNGNCTNGIDRIYSNETYIGDDGSKLNPWPRNHYLNVWVVKTISSGAAGYAYLPGTAPSSSTDGIIILSTYVGSIGTGNSATSRALTHEIGHFLNLQHVWGNTNNPGVSCGNDGVTDTPTTKGWTTCNLTSNHVCNASIEENVQNYMEYSYCSNMFTAGQVTRMQNALNSSTGQRNQLSTSSNWTFTGVSGAPVVCAPIADFMPNDKVLVCAGGTVNFTDVSWNGHPTSWNWSFPGGTPSTSTDSTPSIVYNTPGTYSVTLTAANASGSDVQTRSGLVVVSANTAQYNAWAYYEGAENATTFGNDWIIVNPMGNAWSRVTTAAATGTASVKLLNSTSQTGMIDDLISPSIDISAMSTPVFTFKVAFAQRTSTDNDKLKVYVSTNCGQTWSQRFSKMGAALATHTATNSTYTPVASEWRTETVSISNVTTAANVRIKFEFTSDGGNSIYLDDINIQGTTGISSPDQVINHFDVYPNPAQDNTMIAFTLDQQQDQASLQVLDMTGRVVMDVFSGTLSQGEHQFPVDAAMLPSGMYFVRLMTAEGRAVTQKLIVE